MSQHEGGISIGANLITKVGCYKDAGNRALPIHNPSLHPSTTVDNTAECGKWAHSQGYTHFGMQYGGECWADTAARTTATNPSYAKHGSSPCTTRAGHPEGTGDAWMNVVYTIEEACEGGCEDNEQCNHGSRTCESLCKNGCGANEQCNSSGACVSRCVPACTGTATCEANGDTHLCKAAAVEPNKVENAVDPEKAAFTCDSCASGYTCNEDNTACRKKTFLETCILL